MSDEQIPTALIPLSTPRLAVVVAALGALVLGWGLRSCVWTPAPVYARVTMDEMQKAVALDKWARGTHGPRLMIRRIESNPADSASYYQQVELAGDWIASLRAPTTPRYLVPVYTALPGESQPVAVPGVFMIVDQEPARAEVDRFLALRTAPASATGAR